MLKNKNIYIYPAYVSKITQIVKKQIILLRFQMKTNGIILH